MQDKVMSWIQLAFIVAYEQSLSKDFDLTFDLALWFLFATHRLVMIIIFAKLFINPTMHDKVVGQTLQVSLKPMHKA